MLEVASIIKQCFWLHFSFQTSALFFSDIIKCTNNEAASKRSCKRPLSPLRQKRSYWLYRAHQLALRPFLSWGDVSRLSPVSSQRPDMNHYTECAVLSDQCFFFHLPVLYSELKPECLLWVGFFFLKVWCIWIVSKSSILPPYGAWTMKGHSVITRHESDWCTSVRVWWNQP